MYIYIYICTYIYIYRERERARDMYANTYIHMVWDSNSRLGGLGVSPLQASFRRKLEAKTHPARHG